MTSVTTKVALSSAGQRRSTACVTLVIDGTYGLFVRNWHSPVKARPVPFPVPRMEGTVLMQVLYCKCWPQLELCRIVTAHNAYGKLPRCFVSMSTLLAEENGKYSRLN